MVLFTRAWFWSWINNKNGSGVRPTVKKNGSGTGSTVTVVLEMDLP